MTDAREALLRKVLDDVSNGQGYHNYDLKVTTIPPTGANFTSQLFFATISALNKPDIKVFAKVSVVGENLRDQAPTKLFDIERHAYKKLTKVYKALQDDNRVPDEHRLVMPKFYGCNDTYLEEVVVLQDLSSEGYTTYDRLKSIDWEYASTSVEELAKLHAISIAYQEKFPKDFQEDAKIFKRELLKDNDAMKSMVQQMIGRVLTTINEENRNKLENFLKNFSFENMMKYYMPIKRPVLMHGDFRMSNLMHKVDENGKLRVLIVDYQTLSVGNAANDLLYFIFTGSDEQFRSDHYDQLIDHYYDHLSQALRRLNLDPDTVFPRDEFDFELKEILDFGLIIACFMLPMITMEKDQVPKQTGSESMEDMMDMLQKTNTRCDERLNGVVNDYVRDYMSAGNDECTNAGTRLVPTSQ